MRSRPASRRAFSSACRQRQVEREVPPFAAVLQRGPGSGLVSLARVSWGMRCVFHLWSEWKECDGVTYSRLHCSLSCRVVCRYNLCL